MPAFSCKMLMKQTTAWIFRERHVQALRSLQALFTAHPHEAGETYWGHFLFTAKMGVRFAYVSFVILMHGIFPFLFTRTGSTQVEKLYGIMKSRIPKSRLEELDRAQSFARKFHEGITGDARIAIVGGGFSGAAVLIHLVRRATCPMTIEWFDVGNALGQGVAYSTGFNSHLLNVAAERMGAMADQPEGFYQWLKTAKGSTRAARIWPEHDVTPDAFVPRMLYAEYLAHLVDEAFEQASAKGMQVNIHRAQVSDAKLYSTDSQQMLLTYGEQKQEMLVDALVLATGNLPPRKFRFQAGIISAAQDYVADVWKIMADPEFAGRVAALPAEAEIVIIGSGLTMVDSVLTLKALGYKGRVTAVSRNGLMPASHAEQDDYPQWSWITDPHSAPTTAYGLLRGLRAEVRQASAKGYDWRTVVDSLRPVTQVLWQQLNVNEKRKFLTRLSTFWSIHRHRMAPEVCNELKAWQEAGRLNVVAGAIYHAGEEQGRLTLSYRMRRSNEMITLHPVLVLNCSGPEYDIAASGHVLLKNLRDRHLITVGPLRVGIEVNETGSAKGNAPETLFPVGPMLAGEYLECTAVPELREVASEVADAIIRRVDIISHSDAAAGLSLGEWI